MTEQDSKQEPSMKHAQTHTHTHTTLLLKHSSYLRFEHACHPEGQLASRAAIRTTLTLSINIMLAVTQILTTRSGAFISAASSVISIPTGTTSTCSSVVVFILSAFVISTSVFPSSATLFSWLPS